MCYLLILVVLVVWLPRCLRVLELIVENCEDICNDGSVNAFLALVVGHMVNEVLPLVALPSRYLLQASEAAEDGVDFCIAL